MEFIYAQSPHTMKGLLIGLFFCVIGISAALEVVVFFLTVKDIQSIPLTNAFRYTVANIMVAWIGFGVYAAAAVLYRKRTRDRIDNHYNLVVEYYTRRTRRYSDENEVYM